jgi:hypothetical protein
MKQDCKLRIAKCKLQIDGWADAASIRKEFCDSPVASIPFSVDASGGQA